MAGYSTKHDKDIETKYLRKVLGQVDERIQVPEAINSDNLLRLIEDIPEPTAREIATARRPRWLSLQSGIAYAAAFMLIVALFYATKLYSPAIIDGGMNINETAQVAEIATPKTAALSIEEPILVEPIEAAPESTTTAAQDSIAQTSQAPATSVAESAPPAQTAEQGVGGGGISTLVLEQNGLQYRTRINDISDPDRPNSVTFEVIDMSSGEIISQTDLFEMVSVDMSLTYDGGVVLVGPSNVHNVLIYNFDTVTNPEAPTMKTALFQDGNLIDAKLYKDVLRVASFASAPQGAATTLPHADSADTCVITSYNVATKENNINSFVGAKGTVQLHNLNAYINYTGKDADNNAKNYIAQIEFDGINTTLGSVSN